MYGYVYLTTNLINNRKYVGQHKSNKFTEKYLGSGKLICKAINKYGSENFKVELLEECNSREELDEREIYYISKFDAVNSSEYYNLREGGNYTSPTNKGKKLTKDQYEKLIQSLIGNSRRKGTKTSEEGIRNMSKAAKKRCEDPAQRKRLSEIAKRDWSFEERRKVSNALKERFKDKSKVPMTGRKFINDGFINKAVPKEELSNYLNLGWVLGKLKPNSF